jgi:hypothetical protein
VKQGWKQVAWALGVVVALGSGARAQEGDLILTPPPSAPAAPGPGFFVGPGPGLGLMGGASMLALPPVQAELKLTAAQKTSVDGLLRRLREEQRGFFQQFGRLTPDERERRLTEHRAAEEKQVSALLTPEQQKRYRQIQLQQQGLAALLDSPVAAELKLSDAQRGSIRAALREQEEAMRSLFHAGPGDFNPEAMHQKVEVAQRARDAKVMAALTGEQQRQWRLLLGPPFRFPAAGSLLIHGGPGGTEEAPLLAEPPAAVIQPD